MNEQDHLKTLRQMFEAESSTGERMHGLSPDNAIAQMCFERRDALSFAISAIERSRWVAVDGVGDLPEDGVYLWTCNFGGVRDVRKIQLLTMKDGSRRVGPGVDLGLEGILAYQRLPEPYTPKEQI